MFELRHELTSQGCVSGGPYPPEGYPGSFSRDLKTTTLHRKKQRPIHISLGRLPLSVSVLCELFKLSASYHIAV